MGVNYGLNRVRFTAPVPVGSRVRPADAAGHRGAGARWAADDLVVTVERGGRQARLRGRVAVAQLRRACIRYQPPGRLHCFPSLRAARYGKGDTASAAGRPRGGRWLGRAQCWAKGLSDGSPAGHEGVCPRRGRGGLPQRRGRWTCRPQWSRAWWRIWSATWERGFAAHHAQGGADRCGPSLPGACAPFCSTSKTPRPHAAASTRELRGSLHVLAPPVLATYFLAPLVAPWRALSAPAAGHCHRQLRGRPRGRV
jgi:hypothetical protein